MRKSPYLGDKVFVIAGLVGVAACAWVYLVSASLDMYGRMHGAAAWMMEATWDATYFVLIFLMWAAMMVAMMLPSALPTILIFHRAVQNDSKVRSPHRHMFAFVAGYVLAWCGFSVGATLLQWGLAEAALLSPMMVSASPWLGGAILLVAGVYQWTPLKNACLQNCRSPLGFLAEHWRPGMPGALRLGLHHGLHCVGCCWALMLLLFVGGVMSLLWIGAITAFVLVEKLVPYGTQGGRLSGLALVLAGAWVLTSANAAEPESQASGSLAYAGNYRVSGDRLIGIDPFIMDDGTKALLISDYASGVVRRLFPVSETEFVMGVGFNAASPVELTVRFALDRHGDAKGISLRYADGTQSSGERVALKREELTFQGAEARLAGTLIMPPTEGPRPAIILLHGSGPLTRYSFGPYPHFFSSLGFAVLIYDKRGTGGSTGVRMDASTGAAMTNSRYPDDLAADALAAMRLLQQRGDIDPRRIGFWGSSEGGMLAIQVAARSRDVAFAINSSGFMEPLWKTLRYQVGAILGAAGAPQAKIERQSAFVDLWLRVARTGEGWPEFRQAQERIIESDGSWIFQSRGPFTSLEQLRWDWDHILTFDPGVALQRVQCPVLGMFGELDPLTPAARTAEDMRRVLTQAGHKDFTLRIFPKAGHSLAELPDKNRMAPGVFETLRSWLLAPGRV